MNQKNINKFIDKAIAIEYEEARQAGTIGYMARALVQATLPHSKINTHVFKRKNGLFKLTMLADPDIGLPYGSIPRLILSWITTEAVKTQQREIVLGNTLSSFMSELGLVPYGGRWGSITMLKDQMKRLFSAAISCTYDDSKSWKIQNVTPIEKANLWWDPKQPNQSTLWESSVTLSDNFFNEIINHPIPIDMRALKALKKSPMAIDIYCWLTHRMSYLKNKTEIPWELLQMQFGAGYANNPAGKRNFKKNFIGQLKKVNVIYPEATEDVTENCLILLPSKSHIGKILVPVMNKQ